ncbi:MAG: ankyrin repeat domain-containing protein [Micavibrio sp.]|nr:ankyrin repeat domain-containing protein [Micavibrio sp.]
MTTPAIHTDLLAYNFNIGPTTFGQAQTASSFPQVGQSFMHELAREGDILSAEAILDKGGSVDLPDDEGRRPLHEAAFFGRDEMVRFLLASGAVLDAPIHPFGYTALWFAVQQGHIDIVRTLLERGARLTTVDVLNGQGLLHIAAARGDLKMAGLLIAAGIDVLAEDKRGQTARDSAARHNHHQLENVLVKVMEHHARFGA